MSGTDNRSSSDRLRTAFVILAIAGWAMFFAIAAGKHGERDGDSAAWLTCFAFWAPAAYLLVLGRRSWAKPGLIHYLLIASTTVADMFEILTIAQSSEAFKHSLGAATEKLPAAIGIALIYTVWGSLLLTPLLSLIVFVLGRRKGRAAECALPPHPPSPSP